MSIPTLYIANKNYSSWSFRAWLGLTAKGVEFREDLQRFDDDNGNVHFRKFSPSGRVPVLVDGGLTIWESLAILEYAADKHPDAGFWPEQIESRALARAVANEMHAGFSALRATCPMNMRRKPGKIAISDQVVADVRRIEQIWDECLNRSGGPFLFGKFSIADAMYAPVVNRFAIYELSTHPVTSRYSAAMTALDAWKDWSAAGAAEPWIVEHDEA